MQTETIQVALCDDHRLFRSGIASLINTLEGYDVMLEAANGKEFIQKISKKFKPDIVLMDINMPEMDGIATTKWLSINHPEIKVIILSMFEDAPTVVSLVKMGIKGYLLKDAEPDDFKEALNTVSGNDVYYPPFVAKHLINNLQIPATVKGIKLSDREIDFLKLVGTELTYKQIADQMVLSVRTVDSYRDQLFDKLNVKSRVGLVMYAVKNKLIEI
ncbi:response regulator transcription factor [Mucilaginibacter sp. HMF5004]|uniref:response regulator transcription factor n=1 Tax=Mucilaginibacter rivuli TaxID=2857527 RepID=UPI001C5F0DF5|nr:response regulator transcription factor [Mucilaginibacter rivuli]MBW4890391.1 response regulator transcription factor [Mucilaginibacter rivuli]